MSRRAWFFVVFVACSALAPLVVLAAQEDRAAAEGVLADLEKDPHTKDLCADAIAKSRLALERGRPLRVAGDDRHARLVEGLALEWARVGQELARADAIETRAAAARTIASDAGAHV